MHERRRRAGLCRRRRHGGAAAVAAGEVSTQRCLTGSSVQGAMPGGGCERRGRGCTLCRPRRAPPRCRTCGYCCCFSASAERPRSERCFDKKSLVAAVGKAVFCGRFAIKSKSFPLPPASQPCGRVCRGTARPVVGVGGAEAAERRGSSSWSPLEADGA